jgi:putative phosphoesterase
VNLIGLISDTHGLLRPEVASLFNDVELIIHAGDIGSARVLEELRSIAPVVAVRGNNDTADWAASIPEFEVTQVGSVLIYTLHNLNELDLSPSAAGFHVVVSGHSHRPLVETRDGVLFVNPGSAGPRRFKLPISVARLTIDGQAINAELFEFSG